MVERAGFEPAKSKTPELQSGPVGRLGNLSLFRPQLSWINPSLSTHLCKFPAFLVHFKRPVLFFAASATQPPPFIVVLYTMPNDLTHRCVLSEFTHLLCTIFLSGIFNWMRGFI